MKKNHITLTIGAILVIIFSFMLLTFQVRHTEVAIRETITGGASNIEEGFKFRFPWPINEIHKFDKRIQNSEWVFATTNTKEGKPILVKVFATWRISDALEFFQTFDGDLAKANGKLEDVVRSAQTAVIADYTFEQIVNTDPDLLKLEEIEDKMREKASKGIINSGIEIKMVGIKRLGLTAKVTEAVFGRMKAERQARIEKEKAEGERDAKMVMAEADLKANEILAQAEAQAKVLRGEAEAASAKYYKEFEKNPELANFLFNLNALEGSLKENATLILDPNTPPFNLLTQPDKESKE
ncbi:MAG: protease modulator HflC [Verrucomicrobiota bacterium]|nr:protease modulator HflC [Verrucomicrobiota bacterium]MDP6754270.1 protease modulator HflC [Verrucomicrobiota bacterium]